ncbi:CNVH-domain-containing protein [Colletotrichum zoysiae]|uniref:CNVH-domain-containing protein n=1 Tax=Colletotrichum zoysiae TaxID=1216348 RepID=A0AAD9HBL0_9PEZI|nr:CNVH-domain-containing protein [Colletotrichum zoysiae]
MFNRGNWQGGFGRGGCHQGRGGFQQGGNPQDRPHSGEADSYYSSQGGPEQYPQNGQGQYGQQGYGQPPQHQQNFSPPAYQNQHQDNYNQGYRNDGPPGSAGPEGEDGERGLAGALAGGAAGAFGGHKVGGNIGHSKSSTLIGAVAGAFAGHKLQDGVSDWKHKRDDEKDEHKHEHDRPHDRPEEHHHHGSRHDDKPRSGNYAGGFTGSSRDIRLDAHGEYNLHASCRRRDGEWQSSTIGLNRILENDQGSFRWFTASGGGGDSSYTVQQGDTLRNIAARYNVGFEEIARHNNIANPDQIWPGQVLQVPGRGGNSFGNFGASARDVRLVQGGQILEAELSRNGQWVRSSINLDERIGNNNGTLHLV